MENNVIFAFFLIFFGASVLATVALYTRQTVLIAYIALGAIVGPWGLKLIAHTKTINDISSVGIVFLLFLLGLNLPFRNLLAMLRGATLVTVVSALIFALVGAYIGHNFGLSWQDATIVGLSMMFSSTIVGLKLLPTTVLHHQHIGEVVVSILLMQDMVAIFVLLVLNIWGLGADQFTLFNIIRILVALPVLVIVAYLVEKYVLFHLFRKFDRIREYVFLLAIGWCLGMAEFSSLFGLSHEIGAFIAGVSLAASPISQFIAESLKPLRDFFLIVFFFSVGASFDFRLLPQVLWLVLLLSVLVLVFKPLIYRVLLWFSHEDSETSWEVGMRLGQASEFSLLVGFVGYSYAIFSEKAYITTQAVTIISFIVSSYIVIMRYPSPLAVKPELRRD